MPRKITTITLHDSPDGAAKQINSVSNVMTQLTEYPKTSYKLRTPGNLRLSLHAGSAFMLGAAAGTHFTENQTIKATYDDGAETYWRIYQTDIEHSGERPTVVSCWPYWTMLDRRAVRRTLSPNTYVDVTLALTGLTVTEALNVITGTTYNAPPYFQAGTVASAFSSSTVNIEANGESHLDLLWRLMDDLAIDNSGKPAEFEIEWNSGDSKFDINVKTAIGLTAGEESGGADPSLRPIDAPTGGEASSKANRLRLRQVSGAKEYFNRIIPISSTEEEPVTIGQCEWGVSSTSLNSPSAGQTTINLRGEAIVFDVDLDAAGTLYFGNDSVGFHEILSFTDADTFVIDEVISDWTFPGKFATDASGTELVYLDLAEADSENDISERTLTFDIPPFSNWIAHPDRVASSGVHSADLSNWSAGLPSGWTAISSATIAEVTDAQYVRYGTSSAKVTANAGDGIELEVSIQPTARNPYYSMYVNMYVESGRVRLTFVDGNGTEWPTGEEQAESNSQELRAISVGGMEPLNSSGSIGAGFLGTLKISAMVDDTVFYVDSATVTRTTYPIPYRAKMGLNEMWREASRYLSENGGSQKSYEAELFDVTHFATGSYSEIELGSWVRIRDAFQDGSYQVTADARVVEIQEVEHPVDGRFHKLIKVSSERDTASSRLIGRRAAPTVPEAAPAKTQSATTTAALSQSYFIGTHTGSDVIAGVNVPLRAARTNMQVLGAYIINEKDVTSNGSNYFTCNLRNATQDLTIGTIGTSAAGFTALTAHNMTLNSNRLTIQADDVLYAQLTGAGSGAGIDNMVMVLEAGGIGGYVVPRPTKVYYATHAAYRKATITDSLPWSTSALATPVSGREVGHIKADETNSLLWGLEYSTSDSNNKWLTKRSLTTGAVISTPVNWNSTTYTANGFTIHRASQRIFVCEDEVGGTAGRVVEYDYDGNLVDTYYTIDPVNLLTNPAVDPSATYLYFRSRKTGLGPFDRLHRITLADGTNTTIATSFTYGQSSGVSLDVALVDEDEAIFLNALTNITKFPYPSGGSETVVTTNGASNAMGIDRYTSQLYFAGATFRYRISRCAYDGTGEELVLDDGSGNDIYTLDLGYD